ncbi:protein-tyrosine-phosphatase, partial [Lactobacillus sp. XV13L]|nr:protein-tyrosine-phosphatase [Lactobacillus sp. XV13L]
TIRGGWGDFATFFIKELGLSAADLDRLRQLYLE